MIFELLHNVPEILHFGWADLAKIFIGVNFAGLLAYGWVRSIGKAAKAQIAASRLEVDLRIAQADAENARRIASLKCENLEFRHEIDRNVDKISSLQAQISKLENQWSELERFDGKLWQRPLPAIPVPFKSLADRPNKCLAVANLKGGVGKTTLTANIAYSLAQGGEKVLIVDLDFQGSLTRLCLGIDETKKVQSTGRTSRKLLEGPITAGEALELARPVSSVAPAKGECHVIAAEDLLAEAELIAQAKWRMSSEPDARFLFRSIFHDPKFDRYDWVIFDCPPRLTTACVNALACSDGLLIPVLLEQGSIQAIAHTIGWLGQLKNVCPINWIGIVANRVEYYRENMIKQHHDMFNGLGRQVSESMRNNQLHLKSISYATVENNRKVIEGASNAGRIAAAEAEGMALFSDAVRIINEGVKS